MQYNHPGPYREDVRNLSKPINGVGTAVAGIPLVCKTGPVGVPTRVNSWNQFETIFGGLKEDYFGTFCLQVHFQNAGNGPVWVTRVTHQTTPGTSDATRASFSLLLEDSPSEVFTIGSKYKGTAGNDLIVSTEQYSPVSSTSSATVSATVQNVALKSVDGFKLGASVKVSGSTSGEIYSKVTSVNTDSRVVGWEDSVALVGTVSVEVLELKIVTAAPDGDSETIIVSLMKGSPNFIEDVLLLTATGDGTDSQSAYLAATGDQITTYSTTADIRPTDGALTLAASGVSGLTSLATTDFTSTSTGAEGIGALTKVEDVTLLSVPDLHALSADDATIVAAQIACAAWCDTRKDCSFIASVPRSKTLGTGAGSAAEYVSTTLGYNSKRLDMYYPWVKVSNPLTGRFIWLPPSLVTGVISRVDSEFGNFQDPAGDIAQITGALDFEYKIDDLDQDDLNPLGINCLRSIPGMGRVIWGCRTQSKDPDFLYISVVRHSDYIYDSLKNSTGPYVFKANTPALRRAVSSVITTFLRREMDKGAFKSTIASEAFFVKCDSENNTDATIDEGKLIIEYGIAESKPAEFVIYKVSHTVPQS